MSQAEVGTQTAAVAASWVAQCGTGPPEQAQALAQELAATCQAQPPRHPAVRNRLTGIWHAVMLHPDEVHREACASFCGWRFGVSPHASLESGPVPLDNPVRLCARCYPHKRAEAARVFAEAARAAAHDELTTHEFAIKKRDYHVMQHVPRHYV